MQPAIYIDFDDVLCETARALADLLQTDFGKTVAFDDIHTFNLGVSFGLDDAQVHQLMERGHQEDFLRELEPVPGAIAALQRWHGNGARIAIVTGRPPVTAAACKTWLAAYDVPCDDLIFVDKYGRTLLPGGSTAAITLDALARMPFALAVEDAPVMISFLLARMTMPVAVMTRPWNRAEPFPDADGRLHRCRDWAEILTRFPCPVA